jgi:predicted Zn-dependent protease
MGKLRPSISRAALLVALLGAASACASSVRTQAESAATDVLLPPDQEAKLGQQMEAQLASQVHFVSDPRVTSYVNDLTGRIFAAAKSEAPNLSVKVHVIDDPKTVNAFATPGSQLYVYTGLILAAKDDAELATVLGHETGHIVARHPARHMVDQYGLNTLAGIVLGQNPPLLASMGASIASNGYLLANSRADETEADEYGARFASRAGYDPRALGEFLERISSGEQPGALVFLSDHPTTPDRVEHLNEYIAANGLTGQRGDATRLASTKQALQSAVGGGPPSQPSSPSQPSAPSQAPAPTQPSAPTPAPAPTRTAPPAQPPPQLQPPPP